MDNNKLTGEIKDMLSSKDRNTKKSYMESMCEMATFVLNSHKIQDVINASQLLLDAATQENDEGLRKNYLHFVYRAVYPDTGIGIKLEMDDVVKNLDKFPNNLRTLIDIIGTSDKEEFISYLEPYLNHGNEQVAQKAKNAIDSIKARVAR